MSSDQKPHVLSRRLFGTAAVGTVPVLLAACGGGDSDPLATESGDGGSDGSGASGGDGTIVVGSQQYYSNEIIAELFAQTLEAAGYTVKREYQIGQREVYMPELESGSISLLPEYDGNLLQYYDKDTKASTREEVDAALDDALPDGLHALPTADATDQDSYNVTSDSASQNSLASIADLTKLGGTVTIGGNSELETRPYGPKGLKSVYGVDAEVTPVEDSGGPLTVKALTDGQVQVADIYSSSPAIKENDLVTLEDPESLILPQNVVPIATDAVDDAAAAEIKKVTDKLTTDELIELNRQSVSEEKQSADIAKAWLADQGIVK